MKMLLDHYSKKMVQDRVGRAINDKKPIIWGTFATLILFGVYILILTVANSFIHALEQFILLWYWMTPLLLGFGLQIGLFVYSKEAIKLKKECHKAIQDSKILPADQKAATVSVTATSGISATSMIACCAHHVLDVLPILGLSAAAIFLAQYQVFFLVVGIISNSIGINIMIHTIMKHKLYYKNSILFSKLQRWNIKKILYGNYIVSGIIILATFFIIVMK